VTKTVQQDDDAENEQQIVEARNPVLDTQGREEKDLTAEVLGNERRVLAAPRGGNASP